MVFWRFVVFWDDRGLVRWVDVLDCSLMMIICRVVIRLILVFLLSYLVLFLIICKLYWLLDLGVMLMGVVLVLKFFLWVLLGVEKVCDGFFRSLWICLLLKKLMIVVLVCCCFVVLDSVVVVSFYDLYILFVSFVFYLDGSFRKLYMIIWLLVKYLFKDGK